MLLSLRRCRSAAVVVAIACTAGACSSSSHTTAGAPSTTPATTVTTTAPATSTTASRACRRPHAAGQFAQSFTFAGQSRTYQLYVPSSYDGRTTVPVVFNFHGYGSNAGQQMAYGNFRPLADRHDFVIVAPDGQGAPARHFNLGGEAGAQNDVDMVGALLDHVEATMCIDAGRVFSTGMSDGGAMTSTLACRMPDRFAAFAAVAVVLYLPGCAGSRPVPIMAIAGTADPIVPFNGGRVNCCGGATIAGAPKAMDGWAQHDGCAASTTTRLSSQVERRTWSRCKPGGAVAFYIVDGGGHTWPGAIAVRRLGLTTTQLDASATIWDFFTASTRNTVN